MPFIIARVNVSVGTEQEQEIKSCLGRAIEFVPGKNELNLMICLEDNCRIWLRGQNTIPAAYIEAGIFGNDSHTGYNMLTAAVTETFSTVLGISPENIYIKYDDIHVWGVSGFTIG